MPLFCRHYSQNYPVFDDVVMTNVRSIAEIRAYVHLLEYDNIEGMILLSELSRLRIRSFNQLICVGKTKPVVVIRLDKLTNNHVAKLLKLLTENNVDELCRKTAWHFEEKNRKQSSSYDGFEQAVKYVFFPPHNTTLFLGMLRQSNITTPIYYVT